MGLKIIDKINLAIFFKFIIVIIINFLNVSIIFGSVDGDIYIKRAKTFENHNEYLDAMEVLNFGYEETGDLRILYKWIEMDETLYNKLITRNYPDKKEKTSETPYNKLIEKYVFFKYTGIAETLKKLITLIPKKKNAGETLAVSEYMKLSHPKLKSILEKEKFTYLENDNEFQRIVSLIQKNKELLGKIANSRCGYISYIISLSLDNIYNTIKPYKNNWWLSEKEKSIFFNAAKELAKSVNNELLMSANQDVRDKFFEIYSLIKQKIGQAEFEELKVLQSLQETTLSEQKKGPLYWLEK
ncbi:MAG: esterase FrsA [Candidatus Micrarchaeota archaeon]|nr:esterase FrsA [Candidatus Micrarchaeota archaeon]